MGKLKDLKNRLKGEDKFKEIKQEGTQQTEENPMENLVEETKTSQKEKTRYVVVKELPVQQVRSAKAEDGVTEIYVTLEEALQEMINEEGEK